MARKGWSYSAGEKGVSRVRVFEKSAGVIYLEYYRVEPDGSRRRKRVKLEVKGRAAAVAKAETLAERIAEAGPVEQAVKEDDGPLTVERLLNHYEREVTPKQGTSRQGQHRRGRRVWTAYFGGIGGERGLLRHPSTLDRRDWDGFVDARRCGRIAGWGPVGSTQIRQDLKFMVAVLNWACGVLQRGRAMLDTSPWRAEVRRAQKWQMPKNKSPRRPSMTPAIRARLVEHAPNWRMPLALRICRATRSRLESVRHLRWSDMDAENRVICWRGKHQKDDRDAFTPMPQAVHDALQDPVVERGIGEAWVFPSIIDPETPTPRHSFQIWLRRAKERCLRAVEDEEERARLRAAMQGLGYHGEKRAGVRDPEFRKLPGQVQAALARTTHKTLAEVYDEIDLDVMRQAEDQVARRTG